MSVDFVALGFRFLVTNPCAVVLSVWTGVGGCLCPLSSKSLLNPFPHWGPFGGHFAFRRCFVYVSVVQMRRQNSLAIVGETTLHYVWKVLQPPKLIRILRRFRIWGGSETRMLFCDAMSLVKSVFFTQLSSLNFF